MFLTYLLFGQEGNEPEGRKPRRNAQTARELDKKSQDFTTFISMCETDGGPDKAPQVTLRKL